MFPASISFKKYFGIELVLDIANGSNTNPKNYKNFLSKPKNYAKIISKKL